MSEIQKHEKNELANIAQDIIRNKGIDAEGLFEGAICIKKNETYYTDIIKVREITSEQDYEWDDNREKKLLDTYTVTIHFDHTYDWENPNPEWSRYGSRPLNRFLEEYSIVPDNNLKAYIEEVNKIINGEKDLAEYEDSSNVGDEGGALIHTGSKQHLMVLEEDLARKGKRMEALKQGVNLMMAKKKRELEKISESLGLIAADFKKKVERIQKVIWTIELYLGIEEDIVQIQDGVPASQDETIHFHQEKLYMDEEVGDPMSDNQGLDFNKIEVFDGWLLEYSEFYKKHNYELLIPEEKGLIVFGVRRENKKYSDNPFINAMLNAENKKTYVLMRNGTNIYRIWGDIVIKKLFPDKEELSDMKEYWDWLDSKSEENSTYLRIGNEEEVPEKFKKFMNGSMSFQKVEENKDQLNDQAFRYKQYFLMLQGLIDRTEVFYPIPERIQLMDASAQDKGYVKFVYEDRGRKLADGRVAFDDWKKELNKTLDVGSRIIYINSLSCYGRPYIWNDGKEEELSERLDSRFQTTSRYRLPSWPSTGIYHLEKYKGKFTGYQTELAYSKEELPDYVLERYTKDAFDPEKYPDRFPIEYRVQNEYGSEVHGTFTKEFTALYYNPEDEVRNWWDYWDEGHTRKNRLSFKIYPRSDKNIINYDAIDMDDVNFYLYDRRNRREYLSMMPILWSIKQRREIELQQETEFIKGLIEDMKRKGEKISNPKDQILEAIEWWKTKNKWKRPIAQDDSKAWRMIRKRLGLK